MAIIMSDLGDGDYKVDDGTIPEVSDIPEGYRSLDDDEYCLEGEDLMRFKDRSTNRNIVPVLVGGKVTKWPTIEFLTKLPKPPEGYRQLGLDEVVQKR